MTAPPVPGVLAGGRSALVTIPGTAITTSALGLGCAEMFAEPSARRRRRLLDTAFDAGIRHYDAAPMYGLGLAERELGRFARAHGGNVVIATKFGIAPTPAARQLARLQAPLRRLLRAFPRLRHQAQAHAAGPASGGAGALLYRTTGFDAAAARTGLERSLRELGTDYVDLFLLHDPPPGAIRADDVCAYLEDATRAGHIRAWGLAGELEPTLGVAQALGVAPPVLQLRDDVLSSPRCSSASKAAAGRITFGVLGRAVGPIVSYVGGDPARRRRWNDEVGADCTDRGAVAALLLRLAARNNPDGVVLVGTSRLDHVRSAAAAISVPQAGGAAQLEAFATLIDQLRGTPANPGARR